MATSRGSTPSSARSEELPGVFALVQESLEQILLRQQAERKSLENQRFASMLAHDLRTPLTVVKTSAQIIQRTAANAPHVASNSAAMIIRMVDRADAMIRDLLDFERARAGIKLNLKLENFDLVEAVHAAVAELNLIHPNRFACAATDPILGEWDRSCVRRILENLASNAIKYGDPAKSVTFSVERKGGRALLSIHNHGNPIRKAARASLFQAFDRGPRMHRKEGWGLGLALVQAMTRAHDGTIAVKSSPRHGTTFTISLPL